MHRLIPVLALTFAAALACDAATARPEPREAPDVPWPSVEIEGPLKSPASLNSLLEECFIEVDYDATPKFRYDDKVPDGDDQQPAELCLAWTAHLDVADCVRRGLLDLGGVVSL